MSTPANLLVYTDGEVIGDGVIKLPFAAALKRALPDTRLTWLCSGKTVYTGALKSLAQPVIDEILFLPSEKVSLSDFAGAAPLAGRYFDIVLDTQHKFKRTLWLRRIRHGIFVSATARYLLSDRKPAAALPAASSIFAQLMALGEAATGKVLAPLPLALPGSEWQKEAAELLPEGSRYIGFVPGAGQPNKRWPLELFISLAQQHAEKGAIPVIFLGPMEQEMAETIRQKLPAAILPRLTDPCLTIALAQRLTAAVSNDSGGGHLIAAGGAPLVSLFRSRSVRDKFTPRSPRIITLTPEDFQGAATRDIPFSAVEEALNKILS